MDEAKPDSVQPLAFQSEFAGEYRISPVHQITDAGMSNSCHMYPDLVGASGF
jgi:hypothetical protein